MINKHSLRVLIGFFGMILFGLIMLVIFNHYKNKEEVKIDQNSIKLNTKINIE